MIFVGCDLGSTTGKIVVLDENLSVLGSSIVRSSHGPIKTFEKAVEKTAESMGISAEELLTKFKNEGRVVTTGYGRSNLPGYTDEVSEISCHAKGASHLCPSVRTIIDIGGQDCKVISVGSAGTGRFFEVMSRVLDIDLTHLAEEALKSKKPCSISKQCSVFAESEVISLVNNSVPLPDIAAGIHESIARRIHGMAFKVGVEEDVALTGGCSSNKALRKALEKRLHLPLAELTMDPQLMGALGAALFAKEHYEAEKAQAS